MCAACWFTYLLVYLEDVAMLSPSQAGAVLLAGQLADALATPLVGVFSDQTSAYVQIGSFSFGKRKLWHLAGTLIVAFCYFMVFGLYSLIPAIRDLSISYQILYYVIAASLFNVGWAAVQVSHMSMVPELSKVAQERVGLNSARYGFTVMSNVLVFIIFFAAIRLFNSDLKRQYLWLAFSAVIIGGATSIYFHFGTPERKVADSESDVDDASVEGLPFDWRDWVKCPKYYKVAFIYMCTRLVVNVSQVFVPFFVQHTLLMTQNGNEAITTVPLVVYVSSFLGTTLMKRINDRLGRRGGYILGAILVLAAFVMFFFLRPKTSALVYPAALLLGLGNATIMVCVVSMESDLIGLNPKSAAFVFGTLSFTDKLSNGIVIYLIQNRREITPADIRIAISVVPAIAAVGGLVMTIFTKNLSKVTQVKKLVSVE
jgi:Na+/melibiose symporter-like transporter